MASIFWTSTKTRLKSFTSASKGTAMTIRIELTVTDPVEGGMILGDLADISKAESAIDQPARKGTSHA